MKTSVYTELMIQLTRFILILELGSSENIHNDFVHFQRLGAHIQRADREGRLKLHEKQALDLIYHGAEKDFRLACKYA